MNISKGELDEIVNAPQYRDRNPLYDSVCSPDYMAFSSGNAGRRSFIDRVGDYLFILPYGQ
jgi:hypothetical protein